MEAIVLIFNIKMEIHYMYIMVIMLKNKKG